MIIDEEVYVEHFGVKGQKWGVRKERISDKDVSLKKGDRVFNISRDTPRATTGQVYTAHTKRDVLNYRTQYAANLMMFNGADKVFSNSFAVTKTVKAAGRNAQVDAFKTLWEKDKSGISKALAETEANATFRAAIMKKVFRQDRTDKYQERYMKKGETWVERKGADIFNQRLGVNAQTKDTAANAYSQAYFKFMSSRGYNAVVDLNDVKNYGSELPLLIFKGTSNLGQRRSVKLTEADIDAAATAYDDRIAFEKYEL